MCLGHDLSRQVEPFTEVVETLRCEGVVVPLPRELSLEVAPGGERLAGLDHEEILGVDFAVLREVEVFLRNENALC
jgi:hypothetical protein